MGKKKRQQNSNTAVYDTSEQVEAVDSEKSAGTVQKPACEHITRSVESNNIKRSKKIDWGSFSCTVCVKKGEVCPTEECWVCLQCGKRQCSLEHSLEHHNTPHSDSHALSVNTLKFTIWCHICKSELPENCSKKLKTCVAHVKMVMEKSQQVQIVEPSSSEDVPPPLLEVPSEPDIEPPSNPRPKRQLPKIPPSVRGLINLGNTCFFNSVLQCLARTPNLVENLKSMDCNQHIKCRLKNGQLLEGTLDKSADPLGSCLSDLLLELKRPGQSSNPMRLLALLRKKCPQFEGYEQHDAHELLRHLLDNVRLSDHKRYRTLMLANVGLTTKVNPQEVNEETQKMLKALDNVFVESVTLVPDHVFKGSLISILECQECQSRSHCVESFLDLSLPIMSDKPQPPSFGRRKATSSPELVEEKMTASKRQLKKEKKIARRKGKKGARISAVDSENPNVPTANNNPSDRGESDADVEDNEEVDKRHESGYSSEKAQSESGGSSVSGACGEDSARTSPVIEGKEPVLPVCEGYPCVRELPSWLLGRLDETAKSREQELKEKALYEHQHGREQVNCSEHTVPTPFQRAKRKPIYLSILNKQLCVKNLELNKLGYHKPRISIQDPIDVMAQGDEWKSSIPRNGVPPNGKLSKKRLCLKNQLTSIVEEDSEKNKPIENDSLPDLLSETEVDKNSKTSVDKVVAVTKVVERILSNVSVFQQRDDESTCINNSSSVDGTEDITNSLRITSLEEEAMDINEDHTPVQDNYSNLNNSVHNSNECLVTNDAFTGEPESGDAVHLDISLEEEPLASRETFTYSRMKKPFQDFAEIGDNTPQSHTADMLIKTHELKEVTTETKNTNVDICNFYLPKEKNIETEESTNVEFCNSYLPRNKIETKQEETLAEDDLYYSRKAEEEKDSYTAALQQEENTHEPKQEEATPAEDKLYYIRKAREEKESHYRRKPQQEENTHTEDTYYRRKGLQDYQSEEGECSIQSCLSQFISIELMSGSNKVGCTTCTARINKGNKEGKTVCTIASKQLLIKEVPQVLILHLKRFQVQMYSFRKLSKHVSFPLLLDVAPFCIQDLQKAEEGNLLYSLYGVVEHSGTLNGGHYVAYIKVDGDESEAARWFCISDAHVHEVTEQRVLGSEAYLLFYNRIKSS